MTPKISLLLVEDDRLLREGIAAMLNEQPDFAVVATAPGGDAVLPLVRDAKPQLVLLDSALGEHDSVRLLEAVKEMSPEIRVIVMDLLPTPDIVEFVAARSPPMRTGIGTRSSSSRPLPSALSDRILPSFLRPMACPRCSAEESDG